jgi:hypothetical protein
MVRKGLTRSPIGIVERTSYLLQRSVVRENWTPLFIQNIRTASRNNSAASLALRPKDRITLRTSWSSNSPTFCQPEKLIVLLLGYVEGSDHSFSRLSKIRYAFSACVTTGPAFTIAAVKSTSVCRKSAAV